MEMFEISAPEDCAHPELRERAATSPKARNTHHYVIREGDDEIAFLALDLNPSVDYLVLYELFVPKELQGRGIGTQLLRKVDDIARGLNYERITVSPWPLDDHQSEDELIEWYRKRGYSERPDFPQELEKWLSPQAGPHG
jgi:GNAT superfamily N-acetyltransferase